MKTPEFEELSLSCKKPEPRARQASRRICTGRVCRPFRLSCTRSSREEPGLQEGSREHWKWRADPLRVLEDLRSRGEGLGEEAPDVCDCPVTTHPRLDFHSKTVGEA